MVRKRFFNLVVLAAAVVRRRCRKRFGPRTATGLFAVADRTGRWRCGCSLAQHNASVATTMRATRGATMAMALAAPTQRSRARRAPTMAHHTPSTIPSQRTMIVRALWVPKRWSCRTSTIPSQCTIAWGSRRGGLGRQKGKALSETTAAPARGVLAHWPRLSGSLGRFSCHGHHGHHGHPWLKTWKKK